MQFVVTGRDGTDDGALERRMAVRHQHVATLDSLFKQGKALFGIALTDDAGKMVGSKVVYEVKDRAELDELLATEPYVVGEVWKDVEVQPCMVGPTFKQLFVS